jgi:hypothetical protein
MSEQEIYDLYVEYSNNTGFGCESFEDFKEGFLNGR